MARKIGDRNADYDATRTSLIERLMPFVVTQKAGDAGLRVLAEAAGVSMATLRHYFGDRGGVYAAVMIRFGEIGATHLAKAAVPDGAFPVSIKALCHFILQGFQYPPALAMHAVGLREAPRNQAVAIAYLEHVLDPTIAAVEIRLKTHMAAGEMRRADSRVAAMALVSPIYLACLHQGPLCGTETRLLDLAEFVDAHAEGFLAAYRQARP
jgi:AcrR family transcriptional regulator